MLTWPHAILRTEVNQERAQVDASNDLIHTNLHTTPDYLVRIYDRPPNGLRSRRPHRPFEVTGQIGAAGMGEVLQTG